MVTKSKKMIEEVKQEESVRDAWNRSSPEQRTEIIIDAALRLLEADGIKGFSMRKIAASIGVGTMTLYSYIENQDDLMLLIAERGLKMLGEYIYQFNEEKIETPGEKLRTLGIRYLEFAQKHPHLYHLTFDYPIHGQNSPETIQRIRKANRIFIQYSGKLLKQMGVSDEEAERRALPETGLRWTFLHGMAMLIISERYEAVELDPVDVFHDFLRRMYGDLT